MFKKALAGAIAIAISFGFLGSVCKAQSLCTVTAHMVLGNGQPNPNGSLVLRSVTLNGSLVSLGAVTYQADVNGVITMLILNGSVACIQGDFTGFRAPGGACVQIPPIASTAELGTLPLASPPTNPGLPGVLLNGAMVAPVAQKWNFGPEFSIVESPAGQLNIDLGNPRLRGGISDFFSAPFWNLIPDKPTVFPPSAHTHVAANITDFATAVASLSDVAADDAARHAHPNLSVLNLIPSSFGLSGQCMSTNGTLFTWQGCVTSFNGRSGAVTPTSADITGALGFTPLNKAGDSMLGALILFHDPVLATEAATKNSVDNLSRVLTFNGRSGAVTPTSADVTGALGFTPLNKAGDSLLGALILNADPGTALGAATKQYVDNSIAGAALTRATLTGSTDISVSGGTNAVIGSGTSLSLQGTTGSGSVVRATSPTNVTIDSEATGNAIKIPFKVWIPAASCNNATAAPNWDLPTASAPTPNCVTGTNIQKGVLDYPDTSGGFSAQITLVLSSDWTGNVDVNLIWFTPAITGNAKWSVSTVCTPWNSTATDDPSFNTASTVTTAAPGTANRIASSVISGITVTGCVASSLFHLKVFRDGGDAADTITNTARLVGVQVTVRRNP